VSALHYMSLTEVGRHIKSGELSAVQVTEALLARIAALEPELRSFARVLPEQALATAAERDRDRAAGRPLGPLHGVPIAIKDLLDTRGIVTASGTKVMGSYVPAEDATVVARLKAAGAVIIGKVQLTEGAFAVHHPDIEPPRNPWNTDVWTGVSSSGSGVAVAAGLAFGALGTDTGGSIRFPSASCGLVGIKPTYGRVSRRGAFALADSLDHIGPMTRTVEDAARVLRVIAGHDTRDSTSLSDPVPDYAAMIGERLAGLRIGIDWRYVTEGVDEPVVETVREGLDLLVDLGARVLEMRMPDTIDELITGWNLTCGVECARAHARYYPAQKEAYGPVLAALIERGRRATPAEYQALELTRARFRDALDRVLEGVDLIIAPCMPMLPPDVAAMNAAASSESGRVDAITFTAPFNYSGHPTITLPAGLAPGRLPKAFQLVGRRLGEPTLIRAGAAYEHALGFAEYPVP
jgi:amidase